MQQMNDLNPYEIPGFLNNDPRISLENANEKNDLTITLIQMNNCPFDDQGSHIDMDGEEVNGGKNTKFFKIDLEAEAKFQLDLNDWVKLKSFQIGHRFKKGEWEDYFVAGMKQSNKYCVFAFKDHYVNRACIRKRKVLMNTLSAASSMGDSEEKIFTAKGKFRVFYYSSHSL